MLKYLRISQMVNELLVQVEVINQQLQIVPIGNSKYNLKGRNKKARAFFKYALENFVKNLQIPQF